MPTRFTVVRKKIRYEVDVKGTPHFRLPSGRFTVYRPIGTFQAVKIPPGLFEEKLWRYSYGFTFVRHGDYYGAIIESWSTSRELLASNRSRLIAVLKEAVADYVGFAESDWWFNVKADGEGFQSVPYSQSLDGTWEWWIEEDSGKALRHGSDQL